jgi:hypothetical protein
MALDPEQHRLGEADHQRIFETQIKPSIFIGTARSAQAVAVIFGGQPGAGKSVAVANAVQELRGQGGCAQIIGDDLRGYHPQYQPLMAQDDKTAAFYTDRDTARWIEMSIDEAKARRVNLVIEGTMRDPDQVAATLKSLRAAGYTIDARALAVNPRFSEQGILQRYEGQREDRGVGRMTTPAAHQAGLDGMVRTLERIEGDQLADRVTLLRRSGVVIYANELRNGQWLNRPEARLRLEAERKRPMTLQERKDYAQGYDALAEKLGTPERQARPEEIERLAGLRKTAHAALAAELLRQGQSSRGVLEYPQLSFAYSTLREVEAKSKAHGENPQQQATTAAMARNQLAEMIENGSLPTKLLQVDRVNQPEVRGRGR